MTLRLSLPVLMLILSLGIGLAIPVLVLSKSSSVKKVLLWSAGTATLVVFVLPYLLFYVVGLLSS